MQNLFILVGDALYHRYVGMLYLQRLGVTTADSNNDQNVFQIFYSIVLFATCACNFVLLPSVSQEFDDFSEALSMSLSALTCMVGTVCVIVSRSVVTYNMRYKYHKFKTTLESFEIYVPTTSAARNRKKCFSFTLIAVMMVVVVPANLIKLYYIKSKHFHPTLIVTFFYIYYFHNLSLCFTELHYAIQCYTVNLKFREVNEKLRKVDREHNGARHLFVAETEVPWTTTPSASRTVVYERDFYRPKDRGTCSDHPLANTVELLRIKHWLVREAVNDLNSIFGVQIGVSMFTLVMTLLFDLYLQIFFTYTSDMFTKSVFRSNVLFWMWLLQYTFRLSLIIVLSHRATKQAAKAKKIVTEMSNRNFDSSSKEELQLFYHQLATCSTDLTIYDIFTLNNTLITSGLAAGATFILILVQFHSIEYGSG